MSGLSDHGMFVGCSSLKVSEVLRNVKVDIEIMISES